jgi:hypothetical protein
VNDEHLSLDELAELDEDLLTPERAEAARAHLAGCARCRADADAITSTRTALTALPDEPMPDAVKARIDAALADAAAGTRTVTPVATVHRRRFSMPTMAASAAAAAIVLAFGAVIVGHAMRNNTSEESAGATASGPNIAVQQPKDYVKTTTGTTYTPSQLVADVPALVSGERVPAAPLATPSGAQGSAAPTSSNTANGGESHTFSSAKSVPPALLPLYSSRAKLLACAAYLTGQANAVPLAIDFGRWTNGTYRNAPSAVFVFRASNPDVVDVYVTDPSCSGTGAVRTYVEVPLH